MNDVIRIHIAAHWTAEEFAQLYKSANALYLFFALDSGEARGINEIAGIHKGVLEAKLERMDRGPGLGFMLGEMAGILNANSGNLRVSRSDLLRDIFSRSKKSFSKSHYIDDTSILAEVLSALSDESEPSRSYHAQLLSSADWRSPLHIQRSRAILITDRVRVTHELEVNRTQHSSPGFTDLAGLGQIIGHVKDFLMKLVDHYSSREERQLKNSKLRYENEMAALEVIERKLSLMENAGCDRRALQQVAAELAPHIKYFTEATSRGLITQIHDASNDD